MSSSLYSNKTVADIAPDLEVYNSTGWLSSIVGKGNAAVLTASNGGISSIVLLGKQFFADDLYGNNANFSVGQTTVLIHELLHYATQLGDDSFVSKYNIMLKGAGGKSDAINRWLQNDCNN